MERQILNLQHYDTRSGSAAALYSLCNDSSGIGFFSAGGDGNIVYWKNASEDEGILIARSLGQIMSISMDTENQLLFACCLDGQLIAIDLKKNTLFKNIKIMTGGIFGIIRTEIGYLTVGDNGCVTQLDFNSLIPQRSLQLSAGRCRAMALHNGLIYAGTSEGKLFKVDPYRMAVLKESDAHHSSSVFDILKFDNEIISCGKDGKLIKWDDDLKLVDSVQAHNTTINSLARIGHGKIFASACRDGSIRMWNCNDLELLKVIDLYLHSGHLRSVNKILWNDYNQMLISCSDDRKIKTWKIIG